MAAVLQLEDECATLRNQVRFCFATDVHTQNQHVAHLNAQSKNRITCLVQRMSRLPGRGAQRHGAAAAAGAGEAAGRPEGVF